MDIGSLYQFILLLVLCGFIVGVGVLALDKFSQTPGISAEANTSIVAARDAVGSISTNWFSLIVTVGVLSLIIGLIIGGFYYMNTKRGR